MSTRAWLLQITEANHADNEFYTLGGAGFESESDRAANIASIDRDLDGHVCDDEDRCYMLDVLDPDDHFSIVDDFEITEATAKILLGVDDLDSLRERARAVNAALVSEWVAS